MTDPTARMGNPFWKPIMMDDPMEVWILRFFAVSPKA
jgi:hypothetical protein